MKRIVMLLLVLLILPGTSQAFDFGFGLRGGLNFSSLPSAKNVEADGYRFSALSDSYTGFHFGVVGQFVFTGFFIQPELLYTRTGLEMRRQVLAPSTSDDVFFTERYDHLTLPVLAGAKLGPIKLGAGPVFSLLLDNSNDLPSVEELRHEMNDVTVGLQLGIGLDLANIILDFKYETALTAFGDRIVVDGNSFAFDTRPRQYILSIGFLF
ncbi:MAG: porin family protein [Bacteroidales bacterium]